MKTYNQLSEKDKLTYDQDGYLIAREFFSREEAELLLNSYLNDRVLHDHTYGRKDKDGNTTKLALWYSLDDNIYSLFARSQRMVEAVSLLMDGKPAHFHTKLMQKEPRVGGAWEWHQDYGYWYHDGFLFPQMMSVMVALTPATVENGCLQVIKGSHILGRVDHGMSGGQKGADMERVNEALTRLPLVHVELKPGDTLFFHSNLLHRSDMNNSEHPRCSMISTFNLITNKPFKEQHSSCYTAIEMVADEMIIKSGGRGISENAAFNK